MTKFLDLINDGFTFTLEDVSMYFTEQEKEGSLMTNEEKLKQLKREAIEKNDGIVFKAINLYEQSGNDVTVLIKAIKNLYESSLKENSNVKDG